MKLSPPLPNTKKIDEPEIAKRNKRKTQKTIWDTYQAHLRVKWIRAHYKRREGRTSIAPSNTWNKFDAGLWNHSFELLKQATTVVTVDIRLRNVHTKTKKPFHQKIYSCCSLTDSSICSSPFPGTDAAIAITSPGGGWSNLHVNPYLHAPVFR